MTNGYSQIGWWVKADTLPEPVGDALVKSVHRVSCPLYLTKSNGDVGVAHTGKIFMGLAPPPEALPDHDRYPLIAFVPPLHPSHLGDSRFLKRYGLKFPYIAGAMANGITSVKMVEAMGLAGMLGFFGAAGLPVPEIRSAIVQLKRRLPHAPFGFNLIHSPNDPRLEFETVQLYLDQNVRLVSASAYMDLTLPLVYYRVKGLYRDESGRVTAPNKIIAKVSREEVAKKFLSPPPVKLLRQLLEQKMITETEAALSESIPMAGALTAEADSGGHTDNRPAISLLPAMTALRNRLAAQFHYRHPPCVGLGGGIATPESTAAAFAMGAGYVLTGTVNQACIESGTSDTVRQMLADAAQADVTMAPAADMFEQGIKVQVLKRGTMFPLRAAKLYDLYTKYHSFTDIPANQRSILERDFFRKSYQEEWDQTRRFFLARDPVQVERAEKDPRHQMALVFRSYLGQSSTWANTGDPSRKIDYQIWCGPCIGAFNAWVKGSFLEKPQNRKSVNVALNLLLGASVITRFRWLQVQGIEFPNDAVRFYPLPTDEIHTLLNS
jgi:trans-AT polyketide synthase/acyltransferase/oxidoreductase domain-containing protein